MFGLAQALEQGTLGHALPAWAARFIESAWGRTLGRSVTRDIVRPSGVRIVTVGGATLGGSGKTPLAIACAAELARSGARTVLVGHAYRARPGRPRFVQSSDAIDEVGDEAIVAARALEAVGPRVAVAPSRASAVLWAAAHADALVIDGVAQLAPIGSNLALLSLDGVDPWGRSAAVPPRGDLRAPVSVLLAACDAVVTIDDGAPASIDRVEVDRDVWSARVVSRGAHGPSGEILSWEDLRNVRTGLLTALARPDRVTRALARRGVKPCVIVHGRDHGPLPSFVRTVTARLASGAEPKPELWLATAKCALHAARSGLRGPLATLDYSVSIPPRLCDALRSIPAP